jgi:hypothetical protein
MLALLGLLGYLGARSVRAEINARSTASNPAGLKVSHAKLRRLCPSLYFSSGVVGSLRCFFANGLEQRYVIQDMLLHGDARAAVVVSTVPLLVAAYCDDLDGVCLLKFDPSVADEYGLADGQRLLTVLNSWSGAQPLTPDYVASDVVKGDDADPHYFNFWPIIAEFVCDDREQIDSKKAQIEEYEYQRCEALGRQHLLQLKGLAREGRPDRSMRVAGHPWIVVRW